MRYNFLVLGLYAFILICTSIYAADPPSINKLELKTLWVAETKSNIFVIGREGFLSMETLKKYLGDQPKNTIVEWNPGCVGLNEPFSSEKEYKEFKKFLEDKGLKFVVIPSG